MSQRAEVYNNLRLAGYLEKNDSGSYTFRYAQEYFSDPKVSAISLTLPKTQREYHSEKLFAFFFGLLSEGVNKETQCRLLRIDENDHFSLLLKTASEDTIGAITIKELKE